MQSIQSSLPDPQAITKAVKGLLEDNSLKQSDVVLKAIIEGTTDAIFVKDLQGRYLMINAAGARIVGKSVEEMVGRDDTEVLPFDLAKTVRSDDQAVIDSGQAKAFENVVTTSEATRIFHSLKTPYRNEKGEIVGVIGIARDITELKQAELSQRLLAQAGETLATSLDYYTRLMKVAWLAVPQLADWCSVDILEPDNTINHVALAHIDPDKLKLARKLQKDYPPNWNAPSGVPHVLQTGLPELYPDFSEARLKAAAQNEKHLRLLQELNLKSTMTVPLIARGKILGAMTFVWAESGRRYDEKDLALGEELARRAALAVDNARLFNAEHAARQAAEQRAKHIASLQAITAGFSKASTPKQVADVVIERGLSAVGAEAGIMTLLDEQNQKLKIIAAFGYPAEEIEKWHNFSVDALVPVAEAVKRGHPIFIESLEALTIHYPKLSQSGQPYQALVALPLVTEERVLGGIGLSFNEARNFDEEEQAFLIAIARQCAQALERAHLYEAERSARAEAETAQQQMALLAKAQERNRLAQELHDNVAQALGYLNLKLSMTLSSLSQGETAEVQANLEELKQIVGEAYTDVREEIFNLRKKSTSGLSFLEMLNKYIEKYKRFYNLDIQLIKDVDDSLFEFPAEVSVQIIRTIQEALINVRKHAKVSTTVIRLGQEEEGVSIMIEDEGRGFDKTKINKGGNSSFGLQIMRERIESVGGSLKIKSSPGQGTQIILRYKK